MISYMVFSKLLKLFEEKHQPYFAAVKPDKASIAKITHLADTIGLPMDLLVAPEKMHATVCYSRQPIGDPSWIIKDQLPCTAVGDKLHFFESRNEGSKCLVLKLSSVSIRALWVEICKTGATHDFPTFEPHVTLCYDTPPDVVEMLENYDIPPITLHFNKYECKKLDLEWTPDE